MASSSPTAVSGVGGDSNIVQTTGDDVSFTVGDQFMSFDSQQSRIKMYELVNFTQFWKRDARTIEAAKKRLDRSLNPALKYYEIKFCCIHGGQIFKPSGKGVRNTL